MHLIYRHSNLEAVILSLFKFLGNDHEPVEIVNEVRKHPFYPSMLTISDILRNFDVDHSCVKVDFDHVFGFESPFVAHTILNEESFLFIHAINTKYAIVSNDKWKKHRFPISQFEKVFTGYVLTLNSTERQRKFDIKAIFQQSRGFFIMLVCLLVFVSSLSPIDLTPKSLSWLTFAVLFVKSSGLLVTVLLVMKTLDIKSSILEKLCSSEAKEGCNSILTSNAAKVFEWLSWSEVGFFYFAGTWLLTIYSSSLIAIICLLFMNVLSLPFTVYSVYYQWKIAKTWCKLCCLTQLLLWIEFVPQLFRFLIISPDNAFNTGNLLVVLLCLTSPVAIWVIIKPLIENSFELYDVKKQLQKFKFNLNVFSHMLENQQQHESPSASFSIVLGNPQAKDLITFVSNPYCQPCAIVHRELEDILKYNNFKAHIIFPYTDITDDRKNKVIRHLMDLNQLEDKTIVRTALNDWYSQEDKNYNLWATRYPVERRSLTTEIVSEQKKWCKDAKVVMTPTFFINGYNLPVEYKLSDLKYMFND